MGGLDAWAGEDIDAAVGGDGGGRGIEIVAETAEIAEAAGEDAVRRRVAEATRTAWSSWISNNKSTPSAPT